VPLCFEKSVWVPVASFAVMKAGTASVLLDTTLPRSRLESIVGQLSAKVMLTSNSCAKLTNAPTAEVGGDDWDNNVEQLQLFQSIPIPKMPTISPSSALYIIFTSRSTGGPKGAIVTHVNFCNAIRHHQPELGFERSSRVFDYTSYAFDVAWSNVLHTLTVGACLCIPSEDERTADIHGSVNRLQANFIHLTPTVGRMLDPTALSGLKKVLFIGEAPRLVMSPTGRLLGLRSTIHMALLNALSRAQLRESEGGSLVSAESVTPVLAKALAS
jgi:non-ribosomal peptide synthetase component F